MEKWEITHVRCCLISFIVQAPMFHPVMAVSPIVQKIVNILNIVLYFIDMSIAFENGEETHFVFVLIDIFSQDNIFPSLQRRYSYQFGKLLIPLA